MSDQLDQPKVRRVRGPGKKPRMLCTSLRVDKKVLEYFKTFSNPQAKMREVLTNHVNQNPIQGAIDGSQENV